MSPDLTIYDIANLMDGVEYGQEDSSFKDLYKVAKDNRYVIVFGYSDDGVELRGSIDEEYGAWDGVRLWINAKGDTWDGVRLWINAKGDISTEKCDLQGQLAKIDAVWCPEGSEYSWEYETDIPHATFDVMEGNDKYCRAIIFSLDYLQSEAAII